MQLWYLQVFFITLTAAVAPENKTLCRPDLCINNEVHVGCLSPAPLASGCGKKNLILNVNGNLKNGIVERVNVLRNFVASGGNNFSVAARMPTMIWDYNLQKLADLQIRQCNEHGKFCANTKSFHYVATIELRSAMPRNGNLALLILDKMLPELFLDFMGCKMDESHNILPKKDGTCVGHYIPLIQDYGARMGCSIRLRGRTATLTNVILLCHFSRAKVNNLQPYEIGENPGEKCVTGSSQIYKYLCNAEEVVDANSMHVATHMPLSSKGLGQ
ncbi:antigen 5 like allergen Cul n 1 [Drosophila eugracilis]|uniref:antigen 5 like allergen Cul n 1 n=1 Tax=Drosophila eugracilis TaxID=29029 RepID=UPI0007E7C3C5|nr:antigen 5 like allergen Cul n 1 [Drosophila eugracilis]